MSSAFAETFTIRPARWSDQVGMAHCLRHAFNEDGLFGGIIHPNRAKFPEDFEQYWLRGLRVKWWDWSHVFFVAVNIDEATQKEQIIGVSHWCRFGKTALPPYRLSPWDPRKLLPPITKGWVAVSRWWWPNRAADPAKEHIIEQSYAFTEHYWDGDRAESWYLDALGVHPDHQGRGVGRKLVKWGLDQAEKEGVSASVIAAYGKDDFYKACGYNVGPVGNAGDGEGNPTADVPGGNIYFRETSTKKSPADDNSN